MKFILWVLPVLGFVLGYACAYLFFHGLFETWHLVGKPGEKVARIDGIKEAHKLLVTTETGKIYSFEYGATLVHPPVLTPWGDRTARFQDPDGMQVTLYETPSKS